ncbi:hypothetical protein BSF41_25220 [Flavobacterium sp. ACN2]|uniref:hypothetical protein n=1 Tax=Flavobacterium sp. ACN2 TaxID=1975676 RepID=UPI000BB2E157|nr:hypothetical protein [Flavobacterium sp. ACN2]PBI88394.1 hypothetical protein BSF41_25220 [Flavobacterium sp. ACN2]
MNNNKIIANPSFLQIGFSIFGMLFFLSLAYLAYNPEVESYQKADYRAMWVIVSLFCFFAFGCLYMLLCSKKVELTNEFLSIEYPLLFKTKKVSLDDIKKVSEGNHQINSSHDSSRIEVYNGRQITVEFFELKKITITSFEVSNYEILAQNLKTVTKSYFKLHTGNKSIKSYQGYGWLIFIIILTVGLIFSLIQKNLGH